MTDEEYAAAAQQLITVLDGIGEQLGPGWQLAQECVKRADRDTAEKIRLALTRARSLVSAAEMAFSTV